LFLTVKETIKFVLKTGGSKKNRFFVGYGVLFDSLRQLIKNPTCLVDKNFFTDKIFD